MEYHRHVTWPSALTSNLFAQTVLTLEYTPGSTVSRSTGLDESRLFLTPTLFHSPAHSTNPRTFTLREWLSATASLGACPDLLFSFKIVAIKPP